MTLPAKSFGLLLLACSTAGAQTAVHHTPLRTAASKPGACPPAAVATAPALPPGVPPAAGAVETIYALRYVDTQVGTGELMVSGDFVTVQYTGWLASNGSKFDSSLDRGEPFPFEQGIHQVIPGWDQGFAGMHVGGKRRLFIPYQLAYGETGHPPQIPGKSDLIFDIELVSASVNPPGTPVPPTPATPPQPSSPPTPQR